MSGLKVVEQFILELRKVMEDPTIKISRDHIMSILYRGDFEVVIKFSPKNYLMYLFAPIRTVKDLNRTQGLHFMTNCMAANHLYVSTRGAALSYSPDENIVALNYAHQIMHADAMELLNTLAAFCDTSVVLRKWSASDAALKPNGASAIVMDPLG